MQKQEVTGVILCGGHSSRMGFNKALLKIKGHYVLLQTAQKLASLFDSMILVTDQQESLAELAGLHDYSILEDSVSEQGPLGGIVTALSSISTAYAFIVACDIPQASAEAAAKLMAAAAKEQVILYQQQRIETLFGLYHISCLPVLQQQLLYGEGRIRQSFQQLEVKLVVDETVALRNVNRPAELHYWQ